MSEREERATAGGTDALPEVLFLDDVAALLRCSPSTSRSKPSTFRVIAAHGEAAGSPVTRRLMGRCRGANSWCLEGAVCRVSDPVGPVRGTEV